MTFHGIDLAPFLWSKPIPTNIGPGLVFGGKVNSPRLMSVCTC
jgi:hypothetical protein